MGNNIRYEERDKNCKKGRNMKEKILGRKKKKNVGKKENLKEGIGSEEEKKKRYCNQNRN